MIQYDLSLHDYWRIIRKRSSILILTFLLILLGTLLYLNLQTPVYKASAIVKIEQRRTLVGALMEYIAWSPGDMMVTEAKIIESRLLAEKVVRRLDLAKPDASEEDFIKAVDQVQEAVHTERIESTNLIKIVVFSSEPQKTALIANETASVYVEHDRERKVKQARQVRKFIEGQLVVVQQKLKALEQQLTQFKQQDTATGLAVHLQKKLVELKFELSAFLAKATEKHPQVWRIREQMEDVENQLKALPKGEIEFARLTLDINVNEKLYSTLREKHEEAQIAEAEKTEDVSIVDYASVPQSAAHPKKGQGVVLGILVGLVLGLTMVFAVEGMDSSIGTIEDVEEVLKRPVLGVIPHVRVERELQPWWRRDLLQGKPSKLEEAKARLIVHDQPKSPIAEAYRTLRTNLKLTGAERKTLLVTSAGPREGKTTVLVNLALTAAQMGNRTLIVSSDLRRPALYQTFGLQREPGLNEVLSEAIEWKKALRRLSDLLIGVMGFDQLLKTPGLDNLSILTSGRIPLNPSELLGSKAAANLIEQLKAEFDVVLFDSPPILPITDAVLLAPKVDGVILVYETGRTAKAALLRAKSLLESVGAKMLGVVLNHIQPEMEMYPAYYPRYHRYKYYSADKPK
ncbi:MAG: polysaccharide biosynthesis tyrosine autokinase, partial [Candidatus Omnitrophica bacterium]|nr:polysaccharide biosynthesis tyrosine autokinase [Candidatus Omnitrophota bacterium]